jgi:hypothetical protein
MGLYLGWVCSPCNWNRLNEHEDMYLSFRFYGFQTTLTVETASLLCYVTDDRKCADNDEPDNYLAAQRIAMLNC